MNVEILDSLMNIVGELVLTRNQLLQIAQAEGETIYDHSIQHLNRVTSDVQEVIMKTRIRPIGNAWSKLPRLVRALSQSEGKEIELVMRGAEAESGRQVLLVIQDPLTHIVRNSADHGIEGKETRTKAGKPTKGTTNLEAYQESGYNIIQITDDGAGINVVKVRAKAVERGLVKEDVAASKSLTYWDFISS